MTERGAAARGLRSVIPGRLFLACLILSAAPWIAERSVATIVDGRLSAVSYIQEPITSLAKPDPSTEMDFISRLSLDVREIGNHAWSAYFFGAMRGEVLDAGFSSMKSHLYRGHLQYEPSRRFLASVGRVWVNGGVASSLVDGAQVRWRDRYGHLVAMAGTRGYRDPNGDTMHSWSNSGWKQSGIVSLFYRTPQLGGKVKLGGSWARTMWGGAEESERVGFLVDWRPQQRLRLFYENRYELNQKVPYYQQLRGDYHFRTGMTSLAVNRREGFVPAYESSYIFQRFQSETWFPEAIGRTFHEIRAHLFLRPESWRGWRVSLDLVELFPENQRRGDGLDAWVGKGVLRLGYRGMRGYRGLQDGIYGSLSWYVNPRTRLWSELNRISYRFDYEGLPVENKTRHYTVATRFGADYSLPNGWWFSGVLEALDHPGVNYDVRFLARIVYRFHLESGAKEVQ